MHDVQTRALATRLRCRIVAPASPNFVARITTAAAAIKQIKRARLIGQNPSFLSVVCPGKKPQRQI
jgi:hypothetical protein